ncbi:unnamed protein product [Adineta steineri]|uniref:Cullin-5 n=1 Tax=Adineta steineri TaxID=433720 RepID=A0A813UZ05_9BILA|nr:unnamed protein product [Adineta steineri]
MSQTNTFLNQVWTDVSNVMRLMFHLQPVTKDTMIKLYNDIDNYFRSRESDKIILTAPINKPITTNDSKQKDDQENEKEVDTIIPGGELYFYLKSFLKQYLTTIRANRNNLVDEDFLRFYARTWETYQKVCEVMNKLFTFMNNNWIAREREKNNNQNIYDVYTMSMKVWQDIFFKETTHFWVPTCLKLIRQERDGEKVEISLIHLVAQSYVSAGFTEDDRKNKNYKTTITPSLSTYVEYFEKPFIKETEQYYLHESNNYLEKNSINSYIKKVSERLDQEEKRVSERLDQEEKRVRDYLHPTTLEKLIPKIEEILISKHIDPIQEEAIKLLHAERTGDLRIAHGLITRIRDANKPIQKELENFTYQTGIDAIDNIKVTVNKEPKSYVEAILEVHERFSRIILEGFCDEPGYRVAFDNACGKFINGNAVTKVARSGSGKSAELLAKYCDTLLKKGNKTEENDSDNKIGQIMVAFNYIHDKDVFQKFYGTMLAKRLVQQSSASDDNEELVITKLKEACGFEYSSKLQRMFQDIRISTHLIEEFKKDCEIKGKDIIDGFGVMVLTSNAWPFRSPSAFSLPNQLQPTYSLFTEFYTKKHSGRKLELIHEHSKGELQTLYTKPKYILQVSTYQMAILLLFNNVKSMTVESISDASQIEPELFRPVLLILLKSQVLKCSKITVSEELKESDIKNDYMIEVDESFKSKKVKINLNQAVKLVEQKDAENDGQKIEEERNFLIQAAIVRTMKARKQLDYNSLIEQIIPQLTSKFQPKIPMIKKCIELLIDKEYLERDPNDRTQYTYLP